MNPLSFNLRPIRNIQLDSGALTTQIDELKQITAGWEADGNVGHSGPVDELRERVRRGIERGERFEDYTAVSRRESLLLSLYLRDLWATESAEELPPFDDRVAESVLGAVPSTVRKHIRRLATQLYFTHYSQERLPALQYLADFLRVSWSSAEIGKTPDPASREWHENAEVVFHRDAPAKVAACWDGTWTVDQLADQLCINENGLFRQRLWEAIILHRLKTAPREAINEDLDNQITEAKDRVLVSGRRLGAEAIRILVERSKTEFQSKLPREWSEQIVTFACDPRITNAAEMAKWWGWATTKDKDIAIQALSELTLEQFIKLLKQSLVGTPNAHQFAKREKFLLKLFKLGKVIEARLVVHQALYRGMDAKTRKVLRPSRTSGGRQQTSFICLRCIDDVFLIEGTHNFGLRGFIGKDSFPVNSFWISRPRLYDDGQLRASPSDCDIYQVHHNGQWEGGFKSQLRKKHIEWRGL